MEGSDSGKDTTSFPSYFESKTLIIRANHF